MTMEHDGMWDWDGDGVEDAGPGDAETEDLDGTLGVPEPWESDADPAGPDLGDDPAEPVTSGFGTPVDAHVDEPLGVDDPVAGAGTDFPPPLDLGVLPEPIDGPPWTDAALLGEGPLDDPSAVGSPAVADLFAYAGLTPPVDGDPWAALLGAEDPATAALARWWAPSPGDRGLLPS